MLMTMGMVVMIVSFALGVIVYAQPQLIGLSSINSSVNFKTQEAIVDNPLIGISNTQLADYETGLQWYSPTYAGRLDQQYASSPFSYAVDCYGGCIFEGNGNSGYLTFMMFNFSIPTNAAIVGIIVQVMGYYSVTCSGGFCRGSYYPGNPNGCGEWDAFSGSVTDHSIRLITYGKPSGTEHGTDNPWPKDVESVTTYGGSSNTWGLSLTQNMMMRPDFGVAISAKMDAKLENGQGCWDRSQTVHTAVTTTAYVDAVRMTVVYYEPITTTITTNGVTYTTTSPPATVTLTYSATTITWPTITTITEPGTIRVSTAYATEISSTIVTSTSSSSWPTGMQGSVLAGLVTAFLSGLGMTGIGGSIAFRRP